MPTQIPYTSISKTLSFFRNRNQLVQHIQHKFSILPKKSIDLDFDDLSDVSKIIHSTNLSNGDRINLKQNINNDIIVIYEQNDNKNSFKIDVTLSNPHDKIETLDYYKKFIHDIEQIDKILSKKQFQNETPDIECNFLIHNLQNIKFLIGEEFSQFFPKEQLIFYNPFRYRLFSDDFNKCNDVTIDSFPDSTLNFCIDSPDAGLFHELVHSDNFLKDKKIFFDRVKQEPCYSNYTNLEEERAVKIQSIYNKHRGYPQRTAHIDDLKRYIPVSMNNFTLIESKDLSNQELFDLSISTKSLQDRLFENNYFEMSSFKNHINPLDSQSLILKFIILSIFKKILLKH